MPDATRQFEWFHVILTTYGAWLPGDPRGFRTRNHRQHVEGDYKSPPPRGRYDALHRSAQRSLKQPIVTIERGSRPTVALALRDRLIEKGGTVAIIAVLGRHAHLLVKLPARQTTVWVGEAKKHATFTLRERGRLWGDKAKFVPIESRPHQVAAYRYIERHESQGAFVWRHREGLSREG